MNNELRDYLLEVTLCLTALNNSISSSPLSALLNAQERLFIGGMRLKTARMYKKLADEKDFKLLDKDGYPVKFQVKRIKKIFGKDVEEFKEKASAHENGFYISLREGDVISGGEEPSKCPCGHEHD